MHATRCSCRNRYLARATRSPHYGRGRAGPREGGSRWTTQPFPAATSGRSTGRRPSASSAPPTRRSPVRSCWRRPGASPPCATSRSTSRPGEVFVVMGLSGSGKSTLVRMINRIHEPTAGQVLIDGEDVLAARATSGCASSAGRRSAWCSSTSVCSRTAGSWTTSRSASRSRGCEKEERIAQRETRCSRRVGLGGWGKSFPDELSGGMQQRVGLGAGAGDRPRDHAVRRAVQRARPLIRRDMQDEVIRLQRELQKTMIFITHDLAGGAEARRPHRDHEGRRGSCRSGRPRRSWRIRPTTTSPTSPSDVPRTHVLTARAIMRPVERRRPDRRTDGRGRHGRAGADPDGGRRGRTIRVVDGDDVVGVVDRAAVMAALDRGAELMAVAPPVTPRLPLDDAPATTGRRRPAPSRRGRGGSRWRRGRGRRVAIGLQLAAARVPGAAGWSTSPHGSTRSATGRSQNRDTSRLFVYFLIPDRGDDHGRLRPELTDPRAHDLARAGRRAPRRSPAWSPAGAWRCSRRSGSSASGLLGRVGGEHRDARADARLGHHRARDRHPGRDLGRAAADGSSGCSGRSSMRCRRSRRTRTCCRSCCSSASASRPP